MQLAFCELLETLLFDMHDREETISAQLPCESRNPDLLWQPSCSFEFTTKCTQQITR